VLLASEILRFTQMLAYGLHCAGLACDPRKYIGVIRPVNGPSGVDQQIGRARPSTVAVQPGDLRDDADRADWRFAPLAVPDLTGVAPALVILAQYDPLVDEGRDYAARLQAAGVAVDLRIYPGMIHEFLRMGNVVAAASQAQADIARSVNRSLGCVDAPAH
jgi:acetyl esterase/lipase